MAHRMAGAAIDPLTDIDSALAAAGVTLALGGVQHGFFPAVPSPDRNMPALARDYLRQPALSLADIAFLLGYSEQSAFHRAFKEWSGTNPGACR